jgi:hypothetical protein
MKPVLFQLGPFPVSSFGVFLLLAFVVGIVVLRWRTKGLGWDAGEVLDLSLYTIIGGVVGARIGYVLVNLPDFAGDITRVVTIWKDAGLTFYGALVGERQRRTAPRPTAARPRPPGELADGMVSRCRRAGRSMPDPPVARSNRYLEATAGKFSGLLRRA